MASTFVEIKTTSSDRFASDLLQALQSGIVFAGRLELIQKKLAKIVLKICIDLMKDESARDYWGLATLGEGLLLLKNFKEAIKEVKSYEKFFMASPQSGQGLRKIMTNRTSPAESIGLLIGPEGGFTEEENEQAELAGAVPISLGRRILRAETAAVVLTSLILYEMGDMNG